LLARRPFDLFQIRTPPAREYLARALGEVLNFVNQSQAALKIAERIRNPEKFRASA
jgi:hypothetical protein